MQIQAVHDTLLDYLNSTLLALLLGGVVHTFIRVGAMSTKIDTMWKFFLKEHDRDRHQGG